MDRVVDVWRIDLDQPPEIVAAAEAVLCTAEMQRADRFATPKLKSRFVVGRASLRSLLSGYTGRRADLLAFEIGPYGKPSLPDCGVSFNVSHSGDHMVCAVTPCGPVGIDIECIRDSLDVLRLADRYFAAREAQRLAGLHGFDRTRAFFQCWTRKEAVIKATGLGLAQDLASFEVTFGPGAGRQVVQLKDPSGGAQLWELHDMDATPQYCCAIAIRAPDVNLVSRWFDPLAIMPQSTNMGRLDVPSQRDVTLN